MAVFLYSSKSGDIMVENVEIFFMLLLVFIGIIIIFNARWLIKNKVGKDKENNFVIGMKIFGYILCVGALVVIALIREN